jgi:hypothetical protein
MQGKRRRREKKRKKAKKVADAPPRSGKKEKNAKKRACRRCATKRRTRLSGDKKTPSEPKSARRFLFFQRRKPLNRQVYAALLSTRR